MRRWSARGLQGKRPRARVRTHRRGDPISDSGSQALGLRIQGKMAMKPVHKIQTLSLGTFAAHHLRKTVSAILGASAFLSGISSMTCSAEDAKPYAEGKLVAQIPNLGSLTLELQKEYQGLQSAELRWLFEEVQGTWNLEDGNIVFRKRPSRAQEPEATPSLILHPKEDGTWELMEGGIVNQSRARFFSSFSRCSATTFSGARETNASFESLPSNMAICLRQFAFSFSMRASSFSKSISSSSGI